MPTGWRRWMRRGFSRRIKAVFPRGQYWTPECYYSNTLQTNNMAMMTIHCKVKPFNGDKQYRRYVHFYHRLGQPCRPPRCPILAYHDTSVWFLSFSGLNLSHSKKFAYERMRSYPSQPSFCSELTEERVGGFACMQGCLGCRSHPFDFFFSMMTMVVKYVRLRIVPTNYWTISQKCRSLLWSSKATDGYRIISTERKWN